MKKNLTLISLMLGVMLLISMTGVVCADSSDDMLVKVNVLETEVSISVPDEVIFEDIAQGYLSEEQKINVKNQGTVDVSVSADLDESYDGEIFENLAFKRILADDLTNIRYFDFEIEKPLTVGDERLEYVYMYLDLVDYEEEIESSMMDHNATVIFTAVPL